VCHLNASEPQRGSVRDADMFSETWTSSRYVRFFETGVDCRFWRSRAKGGLATGVKFGGGVPIHQSMARARPRRHGSTCRVALALGLVSVMAFVAAAVDVGGALASSPVPDTAQVLQPRDGAYIIRYTSRANRGAADAALRRAGIDVKDGFTHFPRLRVVTGPHARLRMQPDIEQIWENTTVSVTAAQTDPPWGLDRIDQRVLPLSTTFTSEATGAGVPVYVLDTGVSAHPEFGNRLAPGATAFNDGIGTQDCNGHGTHVAGIAAATTFGVAKAATIVPVRILDCDGRASLATLITGIDWVIDRHTPGTPAIANLSLGGTASTVLDDAVKALIGRGVTTVVAAGNETSDACGTSPARVAAAVTVAASTSTDARLSFSNFGSCVDLFAPGAVIPSVDHTGANTSTLKSGTSMAAPHVAGAAAVMLSTSPISTPAEVSTWLAGQATPGVITNAGPGSPNRLLFLPQIAATAGATTTTTTPTTTTTTATPATTPATSTTTTVPSAPAGGQFHPVAPFRSNDTRVNSGGRLRAGETRVFSLRHAPGDAIGVTANLTAVDPARNGYLTAWQCGPRPDTSNVNFATAATQPNQITVALGGQDRLCVYAHAHTDVIIDVSGWWRPSGGAALVAQPPARIADTRGGHLGGRLGAGQTRSIDVTTLVPASAVAVSLNVTAVQPERTGFITIFPCTLRRPDVSTLNMRAGENRPNHVTVDVSRTRQVCVYAHAPADVVIDLTGHWVPSSKRMTFRSPPTRVTDTRSSQAVPAGGVRRVHPPASGVIFANLTAVGASTQGFAAAFPCGDGYRGTSNVNFIRSAPSSNAVVVDASRGGVCVHTSASTHVIFDLFATTS
jgi:subtilisin family serine protease